MRTMDTARRLLIVMLAVVLFAAACGDDGGTEAGTSDDGSGDDTSGDDGSGDGSGDDGSGDDGSGDDGSGDDGSGDDGSGDGSGDDGSGDDGSITPGDFGDCAAFSDAIDGLDSLSDAADPTGLSDADELRNDFAQAQASIAAMQSALPDDLKDDAQVIADGLAAMEEGFASIGYDVSTLTDPADALAFAGLMAGPDVIAMAGASVNIQQWVTAGCT